MTMTTKKVKHSRRGYHSTLTMNPSLNEGKEDVSRVIGADPSFFFFFLLSLSPHSCHPSPLSLSLYHPTGMDVDQAIEMDQDKEEEDGKDLRVYLPGQALGEGEVLEADQSAYEMLHSMNVQWPCLSFDVLWDQLGDERCTFPATAYVVTGTQAELAHNNEVMVMKMSQLAKTKNDDGRDSDDDSDDDDEVDEDPVLEHKSMRHMGGVNRIRVRTQRERGSKDNPNELIFF